MRRFRFPPWLRLLIPAALMLWLLTLALAQDGPIATMNALVNEAAAALDNDDLPTAQALMQGLEALVEAVPAADCPALAGVVVLAERVIQAADVETARAFVLSIQAVLASCDAPPPATQTPLLTYPPQSLEVHLAILTRDAAQVQTTQGLVEADLTMTQVAATMSADTLATDLAATPTALPSPTASATASATPTGTPDVGELRLVPANINRVVQLWQNGRRNPDGSPISLRALAVSPDGFLLAVPGPEDIGLHSTQTGLLQRSVHPVLEVVNDLAFSRNSARLAIAVGSADAPDEAILRIVDLETLEQVAVPEADASLGRFAVFSDDTHVLVNSGEALFARVLARSGETVTSYSEHEAAVVDVIVLPNSGRFVSASDVAGDVVRVWDGTTHTLLATLRIDSRVSALAATQDERILAVAGFLPAGQAHEIVLLDLISADTLALLAGHTETLTAVDFSPDGQILASASRDATVRLWQVNTGELLHVISDHEGPVLAVRFDPNGTRLYTSGADGTVRAWGLPAIAPDPTATHTPLPELTVDTTAFFLNSAATLNAASTQDARRTATAEVERFFVTRTPTPTATP